MAKPKLPNERPVFDELIFQNRELQIGKFRELRNEK
jgi:hypothetical protein